MTVQDSSDPRQNISFRWHRTRRGTRVGTLASVPKVKIVVAQQTKRRRWENKQRKEGKIVENTRIDE